MEWLILIGVILVIIFIIVIIDEIQMRQARAVNTKTPQIRPSSGSKGYQQITECEKCGARGHHFDHMFCVDPCKFCGADQSQSKSNVAQWNWYLLKWETLEEIEIQKNKEN